MRILCGNLRGNAVLGVLLHYTRMLVVLAVFPACLKSGAPSGRLRRHAQCASSCAYAHVRPQVPYIMSVNSKRFTLGWAGSRSASRSQESPLPPRPPPCTSRALDAIALAVGCVAGGYEMHLVILFAWSLTEARAYIIGPLKISFFLRRVGQSEWRVVEISFPIRRRLLRCYYNSIIALEGAKKRTSHQRHCVSSPALRLGTQVLQLLALVRLNCKEKTVALDPNVKVARWAARATGAVARAHDRK